MGRNLPPADTQISTDAKAPLSMNKPTPSCTQLQLNPIIELHPLLLWSDKPAEHPDVPILPAGRNAEILMASVNGGSHPQWEARKPMK